MFRMPLDTQTEGMGLMLQPLDEAVFADGGNGEILSRDVRCLMMQAVDNQRFRTENFCQFGSGVRVTV